MGCAASHPADSLIQAAEYGDAQDFRESLGDVEFFDSGWRMDTTRNEEDYNLLQLAARGGSESIVCQIVQYAERNLDPVARDALYNKGLKKHRCALALAAKNEFPKVCKILIDVPVKATRDLHVHLPHDTAEQQKCARIVQEGYLKEELFVYLEANDIDRVAAVIDEARDSGFIDVVKRPQIYLDATEDPRTNLDGAVVSHEFVDGSCSPHQRVVRIHPLRFAIENCGGAMVALLLANGADYLERFPSNKLSPIVTACDWISQNTVAASSLSALLEWAWRDFKPDHRKGEGIEVIRLGTSANDTPTTAAILQAVIQEALDKRIRAKTSVKGRAVGFDNDEIKDEFIRVVANTKREVAEMSLGTQHAMREVALNSGFVVWKGGDLASAGHTAAVPNKGTRAQIWINYRSMKYHSSQ